MAEIARWDINYFSAIKYTYSHNIQIVGGSMSESGFEPGAFKEDTPKRKSLSDTAFVVKLIYHIRTLNQALRLWSRKVTTSNTEFITDNTRPENLQRSLKRRYSRNIRGRKIKSIFLVIEKNKKIFIEKKGTSGVLKRKTKQMSWMAWENLRVIFYEPISVPKTS